MVEICDSHYSLAKCLPAKASNRDRFLYHPSLSFRLLAKLKHYEAFKHANMTMNNFDEESFSRMVTQSANGSMKQRISILADLIHNFSQKHEFSENETKVILSGLKR